MIRLGIIGDYDPEKRSHWATDEALRHCAAASGLDVSAEWLPTPGLGNANEMAGYDAFFGAPGSPYDSLSGAVNAIRFAREHDIPFLGTCGGCQHAVIEFAQNVLGMAAHHQEYDPQMRDCVVSALSCSIAGETQRIFLKDGSLLSRIYGTDEIEERYTCHFGLNPTFRDAFERRGFHVTGTGTAGDARAFELADNRFHLATLFQPQLLSTPEHPHRLITAYLLAAAR